MSGIADVLHALGYCVQGSDLAAGANVQRLRQKDIPVTIGHDANNLVNKNGQPVSIVVTSSAVKADNPEVQAAKAQRIPVVRRAEMLAELMRLKWAVAVGGTHGKTTTTSMVGALLEAGGLDPTVINGGIVNAYGTNTRLGQGQWMVAEADESDGTFTRLPATAAVITNIDAEHLDHYGDFDGVRAAFYQFIENIPFYGFAAVCLDCPNVQSLVAHLYDKRIVTYGFSPQAMVRVENLKSDRRGARFDIVFPPREAGGDETRVSDFILPVLGRHNVQNAAAALTIAWQLEIPPQVMKDALAGFTGVKRRFTKTGIVNGITIIDDYGHHPVEIRAVLDAARMAVSDTSGKVIAVMQPHRYSRLSALFEDFCKCFHEADTVLIADVYTAGESPIEGADKDALVKGIAAHAHRDVRALSHPQHLAEEIAAIAAPGDFVICLGAGDISAWANDLPAQLEAVYTIKKTA